MNRTDYDLRTLVEPLACRPLHTYADSRKCIRISPAVTGLPPAPSLGEMPVEEPEAERAQPAAMLAFWGFAGVVGVVCVGTAARLLLAVWQALPTLSYWWGR